MKKNYLKGIFIGIGILISLVYAESLTGTFHFDDSHSVETNAAIRSPLNIPNFWTDPQTSSFIPENRVYRPLVYTFYSICWWAGHGKTWPFHVMKIFMHWMVTLALLLIWRRLWSEPGWFPNLISAGGPTRIKFPFIRGQFSITPTSAASLLAILFSIHPAGSECVDYISATTSLQCAMFYAWAYYFYLRFHDSRQVKPLLISLFLYFLSVSSKEEGITLPAMVLITEFFLARPSLKVKLMVALRSAIPYAILGVMLASWIWWMRPESGNESRGSAGSFEYFMTQWRAYLFYMRIWFWPWDLNADNATVAFTKSILEPLAIQALLGNLLILTGAWLYRKRFPAFLFGMIWFYVTISPASSVVVLAEAINEHRMYLAYLGFVGGTFTLVLAAADAIFRSLSQELDRDQKRAEKLGWIYSAIVLALIFGTHQRNRVWANDENLWLDTVEKNPTSGRAYNNLALVYMGRGEYEKANTYFEKCQNYWPGYSYCPLNLGISYQALADQAENANRQKEASQKLEQAEQSLQRAFRLQPNNVLINYHLGKFYERTQAYEKAATYYRVAISLTGGPYLEAEMKLAKCLLKLKKVDQAQAIFNQVVEAHPNDDTLLMSIGNIELESGALHEASTTYQKVLDRNPSHIGSWYNLGVTQMYLKKFNEAQSAFKKTVSLDPKSEQGWFNLAYVSELKGDGGTAIHAFKQLIEVNPKNTEYQKFLQKLQKKFSTEL